MVPLLSELVESGQFAIQCVAQIEATLKSALTSKRPGVSDPHVDHIVKSARLLMNTHVTMHLVSRGQDPHGAGNMLGLDRPTRCEEVQKMVASRWNR